MRLVKADDLKEGLRLHYQSTDQEDEADRQWAVGYNAGIDRALYSLAYAKTVDAVEVVRCRECEFGKYDQEENKILCVRVKNIGDGELYVYNEFDDYCSYGERKDAT